MSEFEISKCLTEARTDQHHSIAVCELLLSTLKFTGKSSVVLWLGRLAMKALTKPTRAHEM